MYRKILIFFCLFLWGCTDTDFVPALKTLRPTVTISSSSTVTSRVESTEEFIQLQSATNLPETPTPVFLFQICPPLSDHSIGDLSDIISSPYDPPPIGKDDRHHGVDFAYYNSNGRKSIEGEGVTAIVYGWVISVIDNRLPYGNMIILETPFSYLPPNLVDEIGIDIGESLYHLYAHLSESPSLEIGDLVQCGELIGNVGKTGYNIPVAHLHLETRIGPSGAIFMDMAYYDTKASEYEMDNYELWRMSGQFRHLDPMRLFSANGSDSISNKSNSDISNQLTDYGFTYHRSDGNRLVEGTGNLPEIQAVDIKLKGIPKWLIAIPFKFGSLWVVILEDGVVEMFYVEAGNIEVVEPSQLTLPPGMPPILNAKGTIRFLIPPGEDASIFSHSVPIFGSLNGQVYITNEGEIVFLFDESKNVFDLNALIDGRIMIDDYGKLLILTNMTTRYDHGVLGDNYEAGGFSLFEVGPPAMLISSYNLISPQVFEGIAPIWADITGDGKREIILTQSDPSNGAKIVIYDEGGNLLANGPPIGLGYRWRHQIAVAPFGPDGELELAVVRTPHIGGVVEFYGFDENGFRIVAEIPGFSSHSIGSRNLDTGLAGDFDGDGYFELLIPNQEHNILHAIRRQVGGAESVWSLPIGGRYVTNLSAVTLTDGRIGVGIGNENGVLRLWIP